MFSRINLIETSFTEASVPTTEMLLVIVYGVFRNGEMRGSKSAIDENEKDAR